MPTVTALKNALQAQIAPGNPEEFLRLLTEADTRLLEFVKFRWTREKVTLTPVDGIVTLPSDFAAIIACQVGGLPVDIEDDMFEYVPGGVGEVEVGGSDGIRLIDQGITGSTDLYAGGTFSPGTNGILTQVGTLNGEPTYSMNGYEVTGSAPTEGDDIQIGYDSGLSVWAFTVWVSGLAAGVWVGSGASPTDVTSWSNFGSETGSPVITSIASRRQYKVTGTLPTGTTLRAWLHYAPATLYDPDIADSSLTSDATTTTRCPSLAALKLAMLGIIMEEANDIDASGKYFATALRNLDSKESTNRGGATPKVNIRRAGGTRKIRNLR